MNTRKIPGDYLEGLKENWQTDALSGFMVFLIALPLSLGIGKASDFPPIMGLLTAITGGVLVSLFMGSRLTIKGPAAGLIVICSGAVAEFGGGEPGWRMAVGAVVVAGFIQILFGLLRFGSLSDFFPSSVIHGMLAAIGLLIFSKQIYTLTGVPPEEIAGMGPLQLFANVGKVLSAGNPKVTAIGLISLLIVFTLPNIRNRFIKRIPSPVLVLLVAIPLAIVLDVKNTVPAYAMVTIGNFADALKLNVSFDGLQYPGVFLKYVLLFSLIGSIESLLTVKAIDGLDPWKRKSDYNRDVIAVGVGNVIAGFFGGLPMISEVARSSANVNNGARTRWANFFHGFFLLLAVLFAGPLIERIPNAALAALLIGVGYRLASPKEFISTFRIGPEQLVIFVTTILFTIAEDLLIGVAAGILMKFLIEWMNGVRWDAVFKIKALVEEKAAGNFEIKVKSPAVFSNLISFKKILDGISRSASVTVDFSQSKLTDHTFMEMLHRYEEEFHQAGGGLSVTGFDRHHYYSLHPQAGRKFIINPEFASVHVRLTKRQSALSSFAMENGLEFEPKMASKFIRLSLSRFAVIMKSTHIDNLIIGSSENFHYMLADVYMEEGSFLTKMGKSLTVAHITGFSREIPAFNLEKEGLLDLLGLSSRKDIDFAAYPLFSSQYYLSGDNEPEIRRLFSPEVINFFQQHSHLNAECINGSILIYSDNGLIPAGALKNFLETIMKLTSLIIEEYNTVR